MTKKAIALVWNSKWPILGIVAFLYVRMNPEVTVFVVMAGAILFAAFKLPDKSPTVIVEEKEEKDD
jgi:hypothetical protein